MAGLEGAIAPEAVQGQLQRICASSDFDASDRNRRFLQYVVEQTLAGNAQSIKAYSIATLVFGRDANFDPQTDPIIRIEASRLRRSIERYYLTAGAQDQIRIDIPKGSYIPVFSRNGHRVPDVHVPDSGRTGGDPASQAPQALTEQPIVTIPQPPRRQLWHPLVVLGGLLLAWLGGVWLWTGQAPTITASRVVTVERGPSVLVAPFENDGLDPANDNLVRGFTREVIVGLTQFSGLFVYGQETSLRFSDGTGGPYGVDGLEPDFVLTGGVSAKNNSFQVTASLVDYKTGRHIWGDSFTGQMTQDDILGMRKSIASRVVRTVAQPYGVIYREEARKIEGTPSQKLTSYECVLSFYQYWHALDVGQHRAVRACLERTIREDPGYSEAYSALAMVYANVYRYNFDKGATAFDPLPKALELAKRAADMAPESVQSYKALHLVYWLMKDVEKSFEAGRMGLAVSPNDSEMMADLGGRMCLYGQWEQGYPLVEEAYARNPAQPGLYRIVTFFHFYLNGDYEAALAEAEKADIPSVIHEHVILAMAYAQLGRQADAAAAVAEIRRIDPQYGDNVIDDLRKRSLDPDLIRTVVLGLQKAGLDVSKAIASLEAQSSLN